MKKYIKELDILYNMREPGSKVCRKQDLLFPFVKSDSVIIDIKAMGIVGDSSQLSTNITDDVVQI